MIAKVATAGRGFRGLADYLTQDDRASWSESRHVPTDDPRLASRMMAAVAASQPALKRAAGVSARGRKCEDPALHLVLSWRDGETPTREEQTTAADSLLEKLSLADRQACIVAHDDEEHRHVHIMVNRVSWQNGRAAKLGLFKRACSRWASDYERAHRDIQCPRREEVREAHDAGRQIPPRAAPAPTICRNRATGRPEPGSPAETALWRECYAASLAAGDDPDQARARRTAFARRLGETRGARQAIEHIELPPPRPPDRSLQELSDETARLREADAAARRARNAASVAAARAAFAPPDAMAAPADVDHPAAVAETAPAAPPPEQRAQEGGAPRPHHSAAEQHQEHQERPDEMRGQGPDDETRGQGPDAAPSGAAPPPVDPRYTDEERSIERESDARPQDTLTPSPGPARARLARTSPR